MSGCRSGHVAAEAGPAPAGFPEISVVVPTHDRVLRLRWLLNALEEQTLARERFEVVVVHDDPGSETEALLAAHPLGVRQIVLEAGTGKPSVQRNAGWRAAGAPLIAFTDDDCRPAPDWLERALAAAGRRPGAVVQGATRPDPEEVALLAVNPYARTLDITPPVVWAQTCNIVYPRDVLDAVGGFDEDLPAPAGEDTDLALRAIAAGAPYEGAPDAVTYHAVNDFDLRAALRSLPRWQYGAFVLRRHPELRSQLTLGVFWKPSHPRMLLALAGLALAPGRPVAAALALPWLAARTPRHGRSLRQLARSASEVPGQALIDIAEIVVCARGALRYRTPFL